jgi:hypothetical protein
LKRNAIVGRPDLTALQARKHWLTVEWLPKCAPALNDIEVVWHDLKAQHLAQQTFNDALALDRAMHAAVATLNRERSLDPLGNPVAVPRFGAPVFQVRFEREAIDLREVNLYLLRLQ